MRGQVIGGLLTKYLGWRSVFGFLLILGIVLSIVIFVFFRETARSIVGDGSVPPQRWNRTLLQIRSKEAVTQKPNLDSLERRRTRPNPFTSIGLLLDRENFLVSISGGLLYAGYASVTSVLASQLQQRYGYDAVRRTDFSGVLNITILVVGALTVIKVQVGLCYLPVGFGSLLAYRTTARLVDWNFEREAKKQGQFNLSRNDSSRAHRPTTS